MKIYVILAQLNIWQGQQGLFNFYSTVTLHFVNLYFHWAWSNFRITVCFFGFFCFGLTLILSLMPTTGQSCMFLMKMKTICLVGKHWNWFYDTSLCCVTFFCYIKMKIIKMWTKKTKKIIVIIFFFKLANLEI